MGIPYETATSGAAARDETVRLLRGIGADGIGFMDRFAEQELVLVFTLRGATYKLEASAKGWARWWLRKNPHTSRHRSTKQEHEEKAANQGLIAINSILRDYTKGMVAAIESGMVSIRWEDGSSQSVPDFTILPNYGWVVG